MPTPFSAREATALGIADFFSSFYASNDTLEPAGVAFMFGRQDSELAKVAVRLYTRQTNRFVVTGGTGKDSGELPKIGLTEAGYLIALMMQGGIPGRRLYGEFAAKNGGENCRLGIEVMRREGLSTRSIILVAHWASLYRLSRQFITFGGQLGFEARYQLAPTPRPDTLSEVLVTELIDEFRRLVEWPDKRNEDGSRWLDPVELPADLVTAVNNLPRP